MATDANGQPIYQTPTVVQTPAAPAAPTAQTVYSDQNITQAVTSPVTTPNLSDPYGLYDQFMNSAEIKAAKDAVAKGQAQINSVNQALRTTTRSLENQNENAMGGTGASINLIGRQVGRARQLTSDELAALGETQNANLANLATLSADAQNRLTIAQQERSQIQDLIRQTGGKAGISFTDNFDSAIGKAQDYLDSKAKQEKEEKYKDSLKEIALKYGIKTKGSIGDLEKRIKKYNNDAYEETKRKSEASYQTTLLQNKKLLQDLQKTTSISATDIASLYGKNTMQTPSGGMSIASDKQPQQQTSPSSYFNYFNQN